MKRGHYHILICELAKDEGASPECAQEIAAFSILKESRLQPPAWESKTAASLAAASIAAMKALHPQLFRVSQSARVEPGSQFVTKLRNELLERFGITDRHQIAAIIPIAIRHKTVARAWELEPDLFILPPTRDELYDLIIETNPSDATTENEKVSYARSRSAYVFAVGEAWLEATALRRRVSILNDLARSGVTVGSVPALTSSSLVPSTGFL